MRPRISIRGSVGPSVGQNAFLKIAENGVVQDEDASYVVYTALLVLVKVVRACVCGCQTWTHLLFVYQTCLMVGLVGKKMER